MAIIGQTTEGKKIVSVSIPSQDRVDAGDLTYSIRVGDINKVEYILRCNFQTDPDTYAVEHDPDINDNLVGLSVYVGAGTSLSGEMLALGL